MATKKASSKKGSKKAASANAKKKAALAAAKSVSLGQWLATLEKRANDVAAAGEVVGACLLTDPFTGTSSCVIVDAKTCKALKGTFIGGPCGG